MNIVDLLEVKVEGVGVIIPAEIIPAEKEEEKEPEEIKECDDSCGCRLPSE